MERKIVKLRNGNLISECFLCKRTWDEVQHAKKGLCRGCSRKAEYNEKTQKEIAEISIKSQELDIISSLPHKDLLLLKETEQLLGYPITRLTKGSTFKIIHKCNVCFRPKQTPFKLFIKQRNLSHIECKKEKIRETSLKKFGTSNPFQCLKIKEKIKQTNLKKYGFEHPNKSIKQKRKILNTKSPHLMKNFDFYIKNMEKLMKEVEKTKNVSTVALKYNLPAFRLGRMLHEDFGERYDSVSDTFSVSKPESDIAECFSNVKIKRNDRKIIFPKEIDLYFSDYSVAIEYCGLYWHSELNSRISSSYHYEKLIMCEKKGIRLITIFEDEWLTKSDICISRLKNILGLTTNKIGARKCEVVFLTKKELCDFFDNNHLQGASQTQNAGWGLKYDNNIVMALSVGNISRAHLNKNGRKILEIKRVATYKDYIINGGFSRLLQKVIQFAQQNQYTEIRTYCDRRWGTGKVYSNNGFILLHETKYTPHYIKKGIRYRNQSLALTKKDKEQYPGKTEAEVRAIQGYYRIYDCGHQTWVLNKEIKNES